MAQKVHICPFLWRCPFQSLRARPTRAWKLSKKVGVATSSSLLQVAIRPKSNGCDWMRLDFRARSELLGRNL